MQPNPSPLATPVPKRGAVFYGWWVVLSGFLANFAYAEQFNSTYGVFVGPIGSDMGWGRTALAGVQTLSRFPEAIVAWVFGSFVDEHGAQWLMGFGGLLMGGCFFALAAIGELWQLFLLKGILMAIGAMGLGGFIGVTVSNWFVAKRGRAMGVIAMGSSLATAVMPVLCALLIEALGWRQTWVVMGALVLLLTVPSVVFVRRRPEDLGLQPDGMDGSQPDGRPTSERDRRRQQELLAADVVWTRRQLLRTPVLWVIAGSWGLAGLAVTGTNLHLVPFVQDLGYPLAIAAGAVSVRAATMLVGNPIWGFVLERVPINVAASAQFWCKAAAVLLFLLTPTPVGLVVGLILYGIGGAGSQVVQETIWANYYGRISLGLVRGLVFPLQIGIAAFGPLAMGVLYDLSGSYQIAWACLFGGFAISAVLILYSRPPRYPGRAVPAREP